MERSLGDLSGSALRKLALSEVKLFILLLDKGTTEELQSKKSYLSAIFAQLSETEQEELQHLILETSLSRQEQGPRLATVVPVFDEATSTAFTFTQGEILSNNVSSDLPKSA